ncbi:hypothetical protein J3R82DRAFT_3000 [Butyriboletus roseoflavus]|nr:hypothetical protein J3R82DRAFT_3000 [Butyriboletus roseoflavus]
MSSTMYKPDKATTERNARTLRELVKQPDNKLCADCKRNGEHTTCIFFLRFPPSSRMHAQILDGLRGTCEDSFFHVVSARRLISVHFTAGCISAYGVQASTAGWARTSAASNPSISTCGPPSRWRYSPCFTSQPAPSLTPPSPSRNGATVAQTSTGKPISEQVISLPTTKWNPLFASKYESRRWARDGPPPSDPSVLDSPAQLASNGDVPPAAAAPLLDNSAPTPTSTRPPARTHRESLRTPPRLDFPPCPKHVPLAPSQAPQSSSPTTTTTPSQPQPQQQQKPQDDLFSLDFHAPAPPFSQSTAPPQPPTKDVKQDILSLFSAAPAPAAPAQSVQPSNAFGQFAPVQASWDAFGAASSHGHTPSQSQSQSQSQQPISMIGTNGTGLWGVSSGWTGTLPNTTPSANIWGAPATAATGASNVGGTQTNAFNGLNATDIWGSSTARTNGNNGVFAAQPPASKKDDVFGDLWGDFK